MPVPNRDPKQTERLVYYSLAEYNRKLDLLCSIVATWRTQSLCVVGLARGGVIPAWDICKRLGIEAQFRALDRQEQLSEGLPVGTKLVLLVDDIVDTGSQLVAASTLLKQMTKLSTAQYAFSLHASRHAVRNLNNQIFMYGQLIKSDEYIVYPWEVTRDDEHELQFCNSDEPILTHVLNLPNRVQKLAGFGVHEDLC